MYPEHPLRDEESISVIALVLNILWLALGGAVAALGWFVAAFFMAISIIGLPWARAAFDNGVYTLWPFGTRTIDRDLLYRGDIGTGPLGFLGNIIWFVLAGWWLALGHLVAAFFLGITIIGLPFAWAHVKLAGFALWPIGRTLASSDFRRRRAYY
ncbi:YccF domain-containing protein [Hyphococcus luteus]|uniref:YccF domain-containing protein n=1 Tax=Hyphococcus luteus TaxID=2058213 RepID=UPI001A9C9A04|nr:YccF domain-containing protein [Marinicaulis flavus]